MTESSRNVVTVGGGRYAIERRIGSGHFGEVHLAEDLDEGGPVAVKLFKPEVALEEALMEGRLQRRLSDHSRVVSLRNVDVRTSAGPIIVTEYRRHGSIAARIGTGPAALTEGLGWARDVTDALVHAHAQGVLHRDVKPSNLLLDDADRAALCDFGVSEDTITGAGGLRVYPHLIAPELATSGSSARTEVFMVGVLLFRLLCGSYPFPGGAAGLPAGTTVHPQAVDPQIPVALARAMRTALAIDPARRYQDMTALRQALLDLKVVTSFSPEPAANTHARYEAPIAAGTAIVEIVDATRSRFQARLRVDRGRGPRTIDARTPRSSIGLAFRDMRTLLHAVVEGRAP
jgi:serine/threonine protein kinase